MMRDVTTFIHKKKNVALNSQNVSWLYHFLWWQRNLWRPFLVFSHFSFSGEIHIAFEFVWHLTNLNRFTQKKKKILQIRGGKNSLEQNTVELCIVFCRYCCGIYNFWSNRRFNELEIKDVFFSTRKELVNRNQLIPSNSFEAVLYNAMEKNDLLIVHFWLGMDVVLYYLSKMKELFGEKKFLGGMTIPIFDCKFWPSFHFFYDLFTRIL